MRKCILAFLLATLTQQSQELGLPQSTPKPRYL
jgi:hypothetical protein